MQNQSIRKYVAIKSSLIKSCGKRVLSFSLSLSHTRTYTHTHAHTHEHTHTAIQPTSFPATSRGHLAGANFLRNWQGAVVFSSPLSHKWQRFPATSKTIPATGSFPPATSR